MGSKRLISPEEAAELLGVSRRMIYTYVRNGYITAKYDRKRGLNAPMLFERDEVVAVAGQLSDRPTFTSLLTRSVRAMATAQMLERRVARLEELVGAKSTAAPVDEESVRTIYLEAKDDLEAPPTDPERVDHWTLFFMSAGEEFFDALEAYTSNERSWEAFHDLARAITAEMPVEVERDEELRETYRRFEKSRKNLREVLFFHLRSRHGTKAAMKMFEDEVSSHERIVRFLTATSDR